jgi:hypothetical protein
MNRLLAVFICLVAAGGPSRVCAAVLPSGAESGSEVLAPARGCEQSSSSWLWAFLNPWAGHFSGDTDSVSQGLLKLTQVVPVGSVESIFLRLNEVF